MKHAKGLLAGIVVTVSTGFFSARALTWEWQTPSGHLKYEFTGSRYPNDSIYRDVVGANSRDHFIDNRWKFAGDHDNWEFNLDYQLQALHGERPSVAGITPTVSSFAIEDDARLFDLTHIISEDEGDLLLHRLDRFNLSHITEQTVIRLGRQVVSWGNGLFFNPLDFFNPFDPTALDKEYKTGDDMVYGQYLFESGNDLQGVWVIRRNRTDDKVDKDVSSLAFKYHAWVGTTEFDVLLAQHFEDDIAGLGLVKSIGGAVWRGDVMVTQTDADTYTSLVSNLSYSWVWRDTNWSGVLEYFYNDLGMDADDYTLLDLANKPDLLERIIRGELFTTGKHYLAASATIELTPLLMTSPTVFINLDDQSAYLQLGGQYSLAQNWQLTAALNIPIGDEGTEYGGLATGILNTTIATDGGVYVQLGYYY